MYVAWLDGGTAVFAFRGTESVKDALADLNAVPIDIDWMLHAFPEVRGHSGAPTALRYAVLSQCMLSCSCFLLWTAPWLAYMCMHARSGTCCSWRLPSGGGGRGGVPSIRMYMLVLFGASIIDKHSR